MSGSGTPESEEALVSSHMEQEWGTWSRKECLNSPLDEELFPSTHRKVWIKLFLKYIRRYRVRLQWRGCSPLLQI